MTRHLTQRELVLGCLQAGEELTQLRATYMGAGTRLAAIIRELRLDGWNITTTMLTVENRLGGVSHPGSYRLGDPPRLDGPPPPTQLRMDGGEEPVA